MNSELLPYEELLQKYRDLQLRVTRFSSIEQNLINTQDLLDQELVLYKRLSKFNKDALRDLSLKKFIQLVTEAIVDIFETEFSMVLIEKNEGNQPEYIFFTEGFRLSDDIKINYISDILKIGQNLPNNKSHVFDESFLKNYANFLDFSRSIYYHVTDTDLNLSIYLFGLVGKKREANFTHFQTRHETIFSIFAQQVQSLFGNIEKSFKIKSQFETIISSEREQRKLSQIATKTTNGVIISDEFGKIVWVNEAFQNITGYTFEEVIGKKPKDFLQGKDSDTEALLKLKHALQQKEPVEVALVNYKKNGQKYFNALQITPVFDEKGKHQNFIALQKDITEEVYAKNELLRINSRFELITEKSHIGIWEWDLKSGKTSWNQVLIEQYGADNTYMEKDFFNYWKTFLHPDEEERVQKKLNDFIKSGNEIMEDEFSIIHGKTKEILTLRSLIIAERDIHRNLLRVVGTNIDITAKKKFEKNILQKNEELKKINSELDNFVYSVSHDLRSPLLSVKGILSLIFKTTQIDDKANNYLKMAEKSILRLDGTIQEILEYSRNARLGIKFEEVNLQELVNAIYDDLKYSTQNKVEFKTDISFTHDIITDKARINTLLKNIIGNAFKYIKNNVNDSFVLFKAGIENNYLNITVSDNGEGIATEHLSKIFDMFYRASKSSTGTGLGLYICKEIMNKLNGEISISSKVNEGTSVFLKIPLKEKS